MTLLLLSLAVWQHVIQISMRLGFYGLQSLSPAGAALLEQLQQQHQPPWKHIGHTPSGESSWQRSEKASGAQGRSTTGSAGQGLVDGAAAVNGVKLAPAPA